MSQSDYPTDTKMETAGRLKHEAMVEPPRTTPIPEPYDVPYPDPPHPCEWGAL